MSPEAIKSAVLAVIAALIFCAGWAVEGWRKDAEITQLKSMQQAAIARATSETLGRLAIANARGDRLLTQLGVVEAASQTQAQEHAREIRRITVGRPCLSRAVVRLLNNPGGIQPAAGGPLPEAAGESVRAAAAAASDTDVALWADFARRSHDTCRGRLQAIGDFYAGETKHD